MRRSMSLRQQLLLLQVAIVVLTIGLVGGVALQMQEAQIRESYEQRMIGVARSVATLLSITEAYAEPDPAAAIQPIVEVIRVASGVTYVVVTDAKGIRYSHPNADRIGEMVSTDPSEPLAGRVYVGTQTGTLGESWRVKVPIFSGEEVIGFVSVGTLESTLRDDLLDDLPQLFVWVLGAGLVGTLGAVYVSRLVWRRIYRMEPEEIASLREVREAMLHGLGEGMVAVDEHGCIALANDQARRMLGLPEDCVGARAGDVLDEPLHQLLTGSAEVRDTMVLVGEQILFARVDRAVVEGREVGAVLLLRDRTEVHALIRDLDLTQALRAQAHEFANQLHVGSGLVELGRTQEALEFIPRSSGTGAVSRYAAHPGITDPAVTALLLAKTATAHERGVTLVVSPGSRVEPDGTTDVVTVLGNLVDDGPGVPPEQRAEIFEPGVSTKHGGHARGLGLALVQQVVTRRGGTVMVDDADRGGARLIGTLPAPRIAATCPAPALETAS